jgi:hypothetical protein
MLARNARTRAASFALRDASDCAQIDWGSFGGVVVGNTRRRLSFFVMVLPLAAACLWSSRVSQTKEHFLACHEHAFAELGVPSKLMVDNLKSAVLQRLASVAPVLIRAIWTLPATTVLRCAPQRGRGRVPSSQSGPIKSPTGNCARHGHRPCGLARDRAAGTPKSGRR